MKYELGEVIASRELYSIEDNGSKRRVVVKLGKPVPFPDSNDYYAPFQITGIGSETVLCAGGIDAFQAIQEVMKVIDAQCRALNQTSSIRLRWEGDEGGGFGF